MCTGQVPVRPHVDLRWVGEKNPNWCFNLERLRRSVFTLCTLLVDMTPRVLICMLLCFSSSKYFGISVMKSRLIHECFFFFNFYIYIVLPSHLTNFFKSASKKWYVCFGFCWNFFYGLIYGWVFKCLRYPLMVFVFCTCPFLYHSILYMYYQSVF